jgi:hypothetical protein
MLAVGQKGWVEGSEALGGVTAGQRALVALISRFTDSVRPLETPPVSK